MDTYPRLAKELDLAWAPDKSRIVAYNTSNGNVVATLTVKEGLFLSELDGDADPDDVGEFTQRERFRVLSKFASKGLLENDEKFEVSTKGLGTVTLSIPTPALGKTKSSVGLCLYYLAVRYLWVPLAVVCGIIAVFDLNDRYYGDYVPSAFDMIIIIGIALVLHELSHIAAAHYYWIPTNAVGIGLYAPQCTTKNRPRPVPWVESDLTVRKTVRSQGGELCPGVSHLRNTDAGQKLLLPQKPLPCGWFVAQL